MGVTGSLVIAEHGKWDHLNPFNMPEEDIVFTKFSRPQSSCGRRNDDF
ncbi:MAG: hypothetical protein JXA10_08545 [Anaerolineae bacterium]|nr:hypothetical protein [Anaerolineae bacterium]